MARDPDSRWDWAAHDADLELYRQVRVACHARDAGAIERTTGALRAAIERMPEMARHQARMMAQVGEDIARCIRRHGRDEPRLMNLLRYVEVRAIRQRQRAEAHLRGPLTAHSTRAAADLLRACEDEVWRAAYQPGAERTVNGYRVSPTVDVSSWLELTPDDHDAPKPIRRLKKTRPA